MVENINVSVEMVLRDKTKPPMELRVRSIDAHALPYRKLMTQYKFTIMVDEPEMVDSRQSTVHSIYDTNASTNTRCSCNQATICPLGRVGSQPCCTANELRDFINRVMERLNNSNWLATDAQRDYDGMREFQAKFIEADQRARALEAERDKLQVMVADLGRQIREIKDQYDVLEEERDALQEERDKLLQVFLQTPSVEYKAVCEERDKLQVWIADIGRQYQEKLQKLQAEYAAFKHINNEKIHELIDRIRENFALIDLKWESEINDEDRYGRSDEG